MYIRSAYWKKATKELRENPDFIKLLKDDYRTDALYEALEVSRYIINRSHEIGHPVDHMKLQRLMYLVQASFLLYYNGFKSCFKEPITAWAYGPTVADIYNHYKMFGSSSIPVVKEVTEHKFVDRKIDGEIVSVLEPRIVIWVSPIFPEHERMIDRVIDAFKDYSPYALVDLTHRQAPWVDAYNPGVHAAEITNESIYNFFKE